MLKESIKQTYYEHQIMLVGELGNKHRKAHPFNLTNVLYQLISYKQT